VDEAKLGDDGCECNAGHLFKVNLAGTGLKGVPPHFYKL
jgi:hypothetical protein